jgi:hypothetical protein
MPFDVIRNRRSEIRLSKEEMETEITEFMFPAHFPVPQQQQQQQQQQKQQESVQPEPAVIVAIESIFSQSSEV